MKTFFFFFFGDRLKNFCEDLFFFFFGEHLRFVSLVLGLEHSCPWPRECLSSERLSLALASDFFCVLGLGLEPCVLDSTSANAFSIRKCFSEDCVIPSPKLNEDQKKDLRQKLRWFFPEIRVKTKQKKAFADS